MTLRIGWPAIAMLVLFAGAGGAVAAPPAAIDAGTSTRFALAGDRILLFDGEAPDLAVREPDGTVRALHRARAPRGVAPAIAEVAATESQVAFVTEGLDAVGEGGLRWSSLRAGPFAGPFGVIAGAERDTGETEPHDVAIADAGVLFSDTRGVALRPADGGAAVRLGGTGSERLAANGRYAASRTSRHVTAYDLQTRAVVARVAVDTDPQSRVPPTVGVSADGTVVYTDAARRLWSLVPSTRQATLLMDGVHAVARVAGSAVYAVSRTSGSHAEALYRLWAVDLTGGAPRPVTESVLGGDFVTDGARVVYRRDECTLYGDLPAADTAPVPPGCPRQPLRFSVDERQRRPTVRMRVTCPGGGADRCTGTARLTAARPRGRGRVVLGTWRFDAAGGEIVTGTLRVRGRSSTVARLRVTGTPYRTVDHRIVLVGRRRSAPPAG